MKRFFSNPGSTHPLTQPALRRVQEGSVHHLLRSRLLANRNLDVIRFDRTRQPWTVSELDVPPIP